MLDSAAVAFLDELLANADELCAHVYGSYVIRHVLEFGLPEHRHLVAAALLRNLSWYSRHKLGSHVVEAALQSCSDTDRLAMAQILLNDDGDFLAVASSIFGRHVVWAMMATTPEIKLTTMEALWRIEPRLGTSKVGKEMLAALRECC
jgi:hypothetical protein